MRFGMWLVAGLVAAVLFVFAAAPSNPPQCEKWSWRGTGVRGKVGICVKWACPPGTEAEQGSCNTLTDHERGLGAND